MGPVRRGSRRIPLFPLYHARRVVSYVLVEHLHQGAAFTLERARDERDGSLVVIKRLAPERSSSVERARLAHEYEVLRSLDLPGVASPIALIEAGGSSSLVLHDFGGINLASWLHTAPRGLPERLDVAIRIAEIVGAMHQRGVITRTSSRATSSSTPPGACS